MGIHRLERIALDTLKDDYEVNVDELTAALKRANLDPEAVQLVDHNLALALINSEVGLGTEIVQAQVDSLASACVNGMVHALHRENPHLMQ